MQDRGRRSTQIEAGAADEAGKLIALGRMTDQAGGFVDGQQVGVFVEDGKKCFQTGKIITTKHTKHTKSW
jgi:predicted RecA/RadA family phage recombinase